MNSCNVCLATIPTLMVTMTMICKSQSCAAYYVSHLRGSVLRGASWLQVCGTLLPARIGRQCMGVDVVHVERKQYVAVALHVLGYPRQFA